MSLYQPPDPADLQFLIGATLIQICVGQYQLILNFSEHISISVESVLTAARPAASSEQTWKPETPFSANVVFDLLGQQVSAFEILPDASLRLLFGNLGHLTVHAIESGFESYNISRFDSDNHLWVV